MRLGYCQGGTGDVMEEAGCTNLHRTHTCVQEIEPIVYFVGFSGSLGIADEVLGIILFDEILHNRT